MTKKSNLEHHLHFTFFAVPETIIFKISLISTHSSPPTAGSAHVRQRPGLAAGQSASQTRPGSSGDPHSHAQNGSSSVRSPAFSCSKRLKLGPEPHIFTLKTAQARSGAWAHFSLCRGTYLPKKTPSHTDFHFVFPGHDSARH